MNHRTKTLLLLLVLLAAPLPGPGQQRPAARLDSLVATAQQAQSARDYSAAANAYKEALKIEPNMPEMWANLGLMQRQAGDEAGAMLSFQHANRLNPSLYVPNLFLGLGYARQDNATKAIPFLIRAEKANKSDPQAPLALGRAYYASRRYSAAVHEFDRAAALAPKLGVAWFDLGIARLGEVEEDARRMSEEGKQSPFSGVLFAESLHKQARFGEAASLYKSLVDSQPQPPCLRSELGFSLLRENDSQGAAFQFAADRAAHPECGLAFLGQARMAMAAGDYAQSVKLLGELWNRDHGFVASNAAVLLEGLTGESYSMVAGLVAALEGPGIPADFRDALLRAFNLNLRDSASPDAGSAPDAPPASAPARAPGRTAEEFYRAGQFGQCAHKLESGPATQSAEKLRLLAACSFLTGDNQHAADAAEALKVLEPRSIEALYWSIQANERLALKSLALFQQLEPDSTRSHVLLGDIYKQLERFDDAQAEYSKALALAPHDPAAMLGLASTYLSNNNAADAEKTVQAALVDNPEDPELNLIMAEVRLSSSQFDEALPYLEKSLHARPQMLPHIHALIGRAYAETGKTREAVEELNLGASSDEDGAIQYLLARLYRKLGDNKAAAEALDRMKIIKQQRRDRGVKRVEDPDLSPLEYSPGSSSTP